MKAVRMHAVYALGRQHRATSLLMKVRMHRSAQGHLLAHKAVRTLSLHLGSAHGHQLTHEGMHVVC
jgi:hypothetical protein